MELSSLPSYKFYGKEMAKVKNKKTRDEKLAQARLHKRRKYEEIKKDPEKYAIQKEREKLRYLKRKEQKKLKTIKDMTPRQQRNQRKRWRENRQRYVEKKKKERAVAQMLIDNSPSSSLEEGINREPANEVDPLEGPSSMPSRENKEAMSKDENDPKKKNCELCIKTKRFLRRYRYMHAKETGKLKKEIENKNRELLAIKTLLNRTIKNQNKQQKANLSTEQKVESLIENIDENKKEEVKKKLIFGEIITTQLKEGFKTLSKKGKHEFTDVVVKNKEIFKKHKVLTETTPFTVRDTKKGNVKKEDSISQDIEIFFEDDDNTRIAADKKEYIKRDGIAKQKRYLTDTMMNLHKKFNKTFNYQVGYSTFCKYRPFWVVYPKECDRNTCLCVIHVNLDLIVKSLHTNKIIKKSNGSTLLESLCCDVRREECLNRTCNKCNEKVIDYGEFRNDKPIKYYQWGKKIEKYTVNGEIKTSKKTTKTEMRDLPLTLIKKLEDSLPSYFKHCLNIVQQYKNINDLKKSLAPKEVIIHMDFSENYIAKFHEEVQGRHFGNSPEQISLHTSVAYLLDPETGTSKTYSMCTMSECTRHDAESVWAHIIPIIEYVKNITLVDTLHFVTDSPSSQYRNRKIFYIVSQLQNQYPDLNAVTWNYLESGHGKGAPDGIGAVVKRTADTYVRFGRDVGSLEEFWILMKEKIKNIEMRIVTRKDIEEKKVPNKTNTFKGTMSVHQVLWSTGCLRMTFRKLSCFFCPNGTECSHGYHLGYMDIPKESIVQQEHLLQEFLDTNTTAELIDEITNSPIKLDSTFQNSSGKTFHQYDNSELLNTDSASKPIKKSPRSSKVTILSDIRLHWSNTAFYGYSGSTHKNSNFQTDFEKFVNSSSSHIDKKDKENNVPSSDDDEVYY